MRKICIFFVDAFTSIPFKGNSAAVCITDEPLDPLLMQNIAMEINLSETAFAYCLDRDANLYSIRWFTPATEVDLCGHATLATTHVLVSEGYVKSNLVQFLANNEQTSLSATTFDKKITLNFPCDTLAIEENANCLLNALGLVENLPVYRGQHTNQVIIEVQNENIVHQLKPDFSKLLELEGLYTGVAVTSKSIKYDFVSRFFDPWEGINEDPVTGSAHTLLAPYWSKLLNKKLLNAKQISPRGGELVLQLNGNRVYISGSAVTVFKGEMFL